MFGSVSVNQVLRDTTSAKEYRILHISEDRRSGFWIELSKDGGMPDVCNISEIDAMLAAGVMSQISDEWIPPVRASEKSMNQRDFLWEHLRKYLECEPEIFDKNYRKEMLQKAADECGIAVPNLYPKLKRYWRYGKARDAFLYSDDRKGGKGKSRLLKRNSGRKPSETAVCSKVLTEEDLTLFDKYIRKYYLNREKNMTLHDVYDLLKMMLPVFGGMLALLLVFSGFVVLIGKKWKKLPSVWAGILFVGFLTAYIQGTFLAGHLPVLTGDEIDWGRYPVQRLASILLWITVISLTLFVFKKRNGKKIIAAVSGLITLMLIFSLMLTGLTTDGFRAKTDYITTFNGISELSGDKNLVVFLADAVAASKYEELLEKHPEYREGLEDFTYYGNTLGGYPYTTRSIPLIITGRWYENNGSFYSFCNEAYRDFPLLHVLQEGGYRINLYEEEILLTEENMHLLSNTAKTDGSSFMYPAGFYKAQAKLAGFR